MRLPKNQQRKTFACHVSFVLPVGWDRRDAAIFVRDALCKYRDDAQPFGTQETGVTGPGDMTVKYKPVGSPRDAERG